jgi:hypothetical protein
VSAESPARAQIAGDRGVIGAARLVASSCRATSLAVRTHTPLSPPGALPCSARLRRPTPAGRPPPAAYAAQLAADHPTALSGLQTDLKQAIPSAAAVTAARSHPGGTKAGQRCPNAQAQRQSGHRATDCEMGGRLCSLQRIVSRASTATLAEEVTIISEARQCGGEPYGTTTSLAFSRITSMACPNSRSSRITVAAGVSSRRKSPSYLPARLPTRSASLGRRPTTECKTRVLACPPFSVNGDLTLRGVVIRSACRARR